LVAVLVAVNLMVVTAAVAVAAVVQPICQELDFQHSLLTVAAVAVTHCTTAQRVAEAAVEMLQMAVMAATAVTLVAVLQLTTQVNLYLLKVELLVKAALVQVVPIMALDMAVVAVLVVEQARVGAALVSKALSGF
jgi:hypothetical protein